MSNPRLNFVVDLDKVASTLTAISRIEGKIYSNDPFHNMGTQASYALGRLSLVKDRLSEILEKVQAISAINIGNIGGAQTAATAAFNKGNQSAVSALRSPSSVMGYQATVGGGFFGVSQPRQESWVMGGLPPGSTGYNTLIPTPTVGNGGYRYNPNSAQPGYQPAIYNPADRSRFGENPQAGAKHSQVALRSFMIDAATYNKEIANLKASGKFGPQERLYYREVGSGLETRALALPDTTPQQRTFSYTTARGMNAGIDRVDIRDGRAAELQAARVQIAGMRAVGVENAAYREATTRWDAPQIAGMRAARLEGAAYREADARFEAPQIAGMRAARLEGAAYREGAVRWNAPQIAGMRAVRDENAAYREAVARWDAPQRAGMSAARLEGAAYREDAARWDAPQIAGMRAARLEGAAYREGAVRWNAPQIAGMAAARLENAAYREATARFEAPQIAGMRAVRLEGAAYREDAARWNAPQLAGMRAVRFENAAYREATARWDAPQIAGMRAVRIENAAYREDAARWNAPQIAGMASARLEGAAYREDNSRVLRRYNYRDKWLNAYTNRVETGEDISPKHTEQYARFLRQQQEVYGNRGNLPASTSLGNPYRFETRAKQAAFTNDLRGTRWDLANSLQAGGGKLDETTGAFYKDALLTQRTRLSEAQKTGTLGSLGFDPKSGLTALKGIDTEVNKVDKAMRSANSSAMDLGGSFLRIAGTVIGLRALANVFTQATVKAIEFDRTLAQIRATASLSADPDTRRSIVSSITGAAISDSLRTGLDLSHTANIQKTVQMSTKGTLQDRAALGSTLNNIQITSGDAQDYMGLIAPMTAAGLDASSIKGYAERTEMFAARTGLSKERKTALRKSMGMSIAALGTLADFETLEAANRQEASAGSDRVTAAKFAKMDMGLQTGMTRDRLTQILSRSGKRGSVGGMEINALMASGNLSMTLDTVSKGYKTGELSKNELMAIAQTLDMKGTSTTFGMLKTGLDKYRGEVRNERALNEAGVGTQTQAALLATDSIGGAFDRMTAALTAATVGGVTPMGQSLKLLMEAVGSSTKVFTLLIPILATFAIAMAAARAATAIGAATTAGGGGFAGLGALLGGAGAGAGAAAVGIAAGVGAIAFGAYSIYDAAQQKKMDEGNQATSDAVTAAMPRLTKLAAGDSDILQNLNAIQDAEAKGLDTATQRTELQHTLQGLLGTEGVTRNDILDIQKLSTAELRTQAAIMAGMSVSSKSRQETDEARTFGIGVQKLLLDQNSSSRWLAKNPLASAGLSVSGVTASIQKFGDQDTQKRFEEWMKRPDYEGKYAGLGVETFLVDNADKMQYLGDAGINIVGVRSAKDRVLANAQLTTMLKADNTKGYAQALLQINKYGTAKQTPSSDTVGQLIEGVATSVAFGNVKEDKVISSMQALPPADALVLTGLVAEKRKRLEADIAYKYEHDTSAKGVAQRAWARKNLSNSKGEVSSGDFVKGVLENKHKDTLMNDLGLTEEARRLKAMATLDVGLQADPKAPPQGMKNMPTPPATNWLQLISSRVSGMEQAAGMGDLTGMEREGESLAKLMKNEGSASLWDLTESYTKSTKISMKERYDQQLAKAPLMEHKALSDKYQEELLRVDAQRDAIRNKIGAEAQRKTGHAAAQNMLSAGADDRAITAFNIGTKGMNLDASDEIGMNFAKMRISAAGNNLDLEKISSLLGEQGSSNPSEQFKKALKDGGFSDAEGGSQAFKNYLEHQRSQKRIEKASLTHQYGSSVLSLQTKGLEQGVAAERALTGVTELFGSDSDKRAAQRAIIHAQMTAMEKQLELMNKTNASEEERLQIKIKMKEMDAEYLKSGDGFARTLQAKQVGDNMTKETISMLFSSDPDRNQNIVKKFAALPMQGTIERTTQALMSLGADNPIGMVARTLFDPTGEADYKANIAKLGTAMEELKKAILALKDSYEGKASKESAAGGGGGGGTDPGGLKALAAMGAGNNTYGGYAGSIFGGTLGRGGSVGTGIMGGASFGILGVSGFGTGTGVGDSATIPGGVGKLNFSGMGGAFFGQDGSYSLSADGGVRQLDGSLVPGTSEGAIPGGARIAGRESLDGAGFRATQSQATARNAASPVASASGSLGTTATGYLSYNGSEAGQFGKGRTSKGGFTGGGMAVAGASVAIAGYSAYAAQKGNGQAAQNYAGAGAGLMAAGAVVGMTPVGWALMAVGLAMTIMSGIAAAKNKAEENTKAMEKQQADFARLIAISEAQRNSIGAAAERILSMRADVSNVFQGMGASAFLSGRFAGNAPITVQSLTVVANNPAELSSELTSAVFTQMRRGS